MPSLAAFIWHGNKEARVPGAGFGGQVPALIFKVFMDAALEGVPPEPLPDKGPTCDREGTSITEFGRGVKPEPRSGGGTTQETVPIPQTTPTLPTWTPATASRPPTITVPTISEPTTTPPTEPPPGP